jgi:[acyl-carrier-protein] S-malonyltransferase
MAKIAFVFPGQGSQAVGMGKDIYEEYSVAKKVFNEADQVLGRKISELCFNGPEEALKDTTNAQPTILTTSIALFETLKKEGITPDFVAGHSLGEYSALVAGGAISFSDALTLVNKRAQLMANADPERQGSMAAVLGLDRESLIEILNQASELGTVEAANFNCPGQIVISGAKEGISKAQELISAKGGKLIPLAVSGPFHSSFMKPAADAFLSDLNQKKWEEPKTTVIANVTAQPVVKAELTDSLYRQIFSSVLWEDTLRFLNGQGVNVIVEVGPGKVLSGLVKKTLKDITMINCGDSESVKKALAILKEV